MRHPAAYHIIETNRERDQSGSLAKMRRFREAAERRSRIDRVLTNIESQIQFAMAQNDIDGARYWQERRRAVMVADASGASAREAVRAGMDRS